MKRALLFLLLCLSVVASPSARADTASESRLDPKAIPEPLKPWAAWATHDKAAALCPGFEGMAQLSRCVWPARLTLTLDDHGGSFSQIVHVDAPAFVPLPGDAKRWPLDVKVGTGRAAVVERDAVPSVWLSQGDHTITGRLAWDSIPESIRVPPETGLLSLTLRNTVVAEPLRDADGTVWLQKKSTAVEGEKLEIVVHRRVTDSVPLVLTTRIILNASGKNREELLGRALPAGFSPLSLQSPIPARLESDGRLRIQVRPGTFTIELVARSEGAVQAISRPDPGGPWRDGEEVWVFEAQADLRLVTVEGVPAIDPQQTTLPDGWRSLPAYTMNKQAAMRLVEKRRGDADPGPDQLTLDRTLWLDFDGKGLTASDTIQGALHRVSRLEMLAPTQLGRVTVKNKDQLITSVGGDTHGIEVRQGKLEVTADSRITSSTSEIPAVGWNHDFSKVSARLNLPPGYRLLHAFGVDEVPDTWIKHWSLLEIFLVLIFSIAIVRLYGFKWGAIAFITFVLTFPESGAPKWTLIPLLVLEALIQVLPERSWKRVFVWLRFAALVPLLLIGLAFIIEHVRFGMYPALSRGDSSGSFSDLTIGMQKSTGKFDEGVAAAPGATAFANMNNDTEESRPAPQAPKEAQQEIANDAKTKKPAAPAQGRKLGQAQNEPQSQSASSWSRKGQSDYAQMNSDVYDPNAMVQTGPGKPKWSWTTLSLSWSGPVERTQKVRLFILPPWGNLLLAFFRAALITTLLARFIPWKRIGQTLGPNTPNTPAGAAGAGGTEGTSATSGTVATAIVILGIAFSTFSAGEARADMPSDEMLKTLQERLTAKPSCSPHCATIGRLSVDVGGGVIVMRTEVDALADIAIPLPGDPAQLAISGVSIDGKAASSVARTADGKAWALVPKGTHQVTVEARLPDRESFQLPLPLKPHRVEAHVVGWTLEGLHEDGLADDSLQFTRIRTKESDAGTLQPGALPPFVQVERTLLIGLNWQVRTKVTRLSPAGAAIVLEIPLLQGESVTTADVRVSSGKVLLNLGQSANEAEWKSVLDERATLALTAPKATGWIEIWRLDLSPIWHAEFSGIPVIHAQAKEGKVPEWRPWPGETASIAISRPKGVPGQTVTIDESEYVVRPGLRTTDATLRLVMRSSRGAEHVVTLPEGSVVDSLTIGGKTVPIRQDAARVTFPLVPGSQEVKVAWHEPRGITSMFSTSVTDLGVRNVNATLRVELPASRWLLFLGGPRLGPSVLFWSLLLCLVVVAVMLGRIKWTPVRTWQWLLLALGLSQVPLVLGAVVVGWILLVGWRERGATLPTTTGGAAWFNIRQLFVVFWTFIALVVLVVAVHHGLLGQPDMEIHGPNAETLQWFQDRLEGPSATALVVSLPLFVFRALMLAWALWLAFSVLSWLKWTWRSFGSGGYWARGIGLPPLTSLGAQQAQHAGQTQQTQQTQQAQQAEQARAYYYAAQAAQANAAQTHGSPPHVPAPDAAQTQTPADRQHESPATPNASQPKGDDPSSNKS